MPSAKVEYFGAAKEDGGIVAKDCGGKEDCGAPPKDAGVRFDIVWNDCIGACVGYDIDIGGPITPGGADCITFGVDWGGSMGKD
jgi:hypothetical protein